MSFSKRLWRSLLFILLISALCGGLVMPMLAPARAAPQMQAAIDLVISEIRFRGSAGANDEFIEIYNPTTSRVNLNGWVISGSNNAGTTSNRYTFTTNILLESGQYYLIARTGYDDSVTPDATYGTGITDDGGVALLRPDSSIADQVGMTASCAPLTCFVEGAPLMSLGSTASSNLDRSYERTPGGTADSCDDTADNSSDFQLINPSQPQNSSTPFSLCGAPPPTFTSTSTPSDTPTATSTSSSTTTSTITRTPTPIGLRSIIINEVAWAGTVASSNDEWIELRNTTTAEDRKSTSELQSQSNLVCRLLLEKKK